MLFSLNFTNHFLSSQASLLYFNFAFKITQFNYYYSQTCPNNHLYKTTSNLWQPIMSLPKQIPIQSLLYNITTCLSLFKIKIPARVAKSSHQDCGQCYLQSTIFFLYIQSVTLCLLLTFNTIVNYIFTKNVTEILTFSSIFWFSYLYLLQKMTSASIT